MELHLRRATEEHTTACITDQGCSSDAALDTSFPKGPTNIFEIPRPCNSGSFLHCRPFTFSEVK